MPTMEGNMTGAGFLRNSASPTALHPAVSGTRPEHGGSSQGFNNKSAPAADQEREEDDSAEATAVITPATIGSSSSPATVSEPEAPEATTAPAPSDVTSAGTTPTATVTTTSAAIAIAPVYAAGLDQPEPSRSPDNKPFRPAPISVVAPAAAGAVSKTQEQATEAHSPTLVASTVVTSPGGPSSSSLLSSAIPRDIARPEQPGSTRPPPLLLNTHSNPASSNTSAYRCNAPFRDSVPQQTVIKALASVAHQRKKPDLVLLDNPTSQSPARLRDGKDYYPRTRSHCKSKSLSILHEMLSTQRGEGSQPVAEFRSDSLSNSASESQSSAASSTSSSSVGSSNSVPAATNSPVTQTQTHVQSPSQSLTDALNDIAKSRLTSPNPSTPMATATPILTPITAVLSGSHASTSNSTSAIAHNPAISNCPDTPATVTSTVMTAPNPLVVPSTLQSPCFYHERFADAVDIGKVLEEIKNDVSMSHSRLVATATGVREVSKQLQRRPIRRAVRNIMIVTKARDNQLVYLTRELACWLLRTPRYGSDLGVNVYVDAKLRNSRRFDAASILAENPRFQHMLKYWTPDLCWSQPEKFDLVLTLGGDGTVLFTSWLFQRIVPPVLSFSLGSLGFMTTFEFNKYKEHLNRVMGDDGMKINLRMRFTCTVYRNNQHGGPHLEEGEQFEVLNELVIDRGPSPYVSNLELYGDDELLTVVQADGCIFSTPTGSTAYSLSAGGALVHPDIPAILLTPICPHTLSFRPMVLSDTMALRVSVPRNSRATAYCAFDGKGRLELRQGDHVTITASQYPFPTVTRTDTEWFDSVSRTLRWNVRAAAQKPFEDGTPTDNCEDDLGWDIDTDSAFYGSEEGSVSASPIRRQMSLLGL